MLRVGSDTKTESLRLEAFPPVASMNARLLILGSMPSAVSLEHHQYYAHPRNHFWTIIEKLFGASARLDYHARCGKLIANRIALWDVISDCKRVGSLDANIIEESIRVNNFEVFFRRYKQIRAVFFNGSKAEQIYRKYVGSTLPKDIRVSYVKLPSTSPANATWNLAEKLKAWEIIKRENQARG